MANTVRIRNGMSNATEGDILGNFGDLVGVGVVDKANGHLLVTEDSPRGMSIQVAGGIVYVPNADYNQLDSDTPKFYPVVCDAEALTIDNNTSGQTRNDIVCVKVDKSIFPDADASNIATKVVVKGTAGGGIPTTPANHYKLAEIEVVNGETEIENSMITDTREQITLQERLINLTASSTTNITGLVGGDGTNIEQVTKPTGDIVGTTDTQTLTNKTLTAPALSSPTISGAWDGWISAGETWTYASATTITVPSGAASKYQKGDKIKITNNSATKYFYVVGVADTVLTVTGGSDYTVHDSAITNPYFSKIENPQGFPMWFNWTPSYGGTFSSVTTGVAKFMVKGDSYIAMIGCRGTLSVVTPFITFTGPLTPSGSPADFAGACRVEDVRGFAGYWQHQGSNIFRVYKYDTSNYSAGTNTIGFMISPFSCSY